MAKFLTTAAVAYQIERIIVESKKKLVLVSPYIKITKTFLERLQDASGRNVQIIIIYGKSELNATEKKQLDSIVGLKLYYFDNLHAKCYFNESELVITSMNLYEFSERKNREMGVFVTKKEDETLFNDTVNETHSIIKSATLIVAKNSIANKNETIENMKLTSIKTSLRIENLIEGNCIRCKNVVELNTKKPYCKDCFASWSYWSNPYFEEKFCHDCGAIYCSTIEKPICSNCIKKNEILVPIKTLSLTNEIVIPLTEEKIESLRDFFINKFTDTKINSSQQYVYCNGLLKCGDVMFREGIEIRFHYGLVRINDFVRIIDGLDLNTINFKYKKEIVTKNDKISAIILLPENVNNLENLIFDYYFIIRKIIHEIRSISTKQNQFF